jgi:hypothetical protein
MNKLDRIVERHSDSFGKGTDELALRIGMHSGEVTAGVLRGEKGRFQLFGGELEHLNDRRTRLYHLLVSRNSPGARRVSHF